MKMVTEWFVFGMFQGDSSMKWNLTKEGRRPLHEYQMKWDQEKQDSVPIIPRETEVYYLCKYAEFLMVMINSTKSIRT